MTDDDLIAARFGTPGKRRRRDDDEPRPPCRREYPRVQGEPRPSPPRAVPLAEDPANDWLLDGDLDPLVVACHFWLEGERGPIRLEHVLDVFGAPPHLRGTPSYLARVARALERVGFTTVDGRRWTRPPRTSCEATNV